MTTIPETAVLLDPAKTSIDDLYTLLGEQIPGQDAFGTDQLLKGKAAYENMKTALRRAICPKICEPQHKTLIASQQSSDTIALAAVIAGMVSATSFGVTVNSTLIAALVIRIGLRNLCKDLPS